MDDTAQPMEKGIPASPVKVVSVQTVGANGAPATTVSNAAGVTLVVQFNRPTLPKTFLEVGNAPSISSTTGQPVLVYQRSQLLPVGVTNFRVAVSKNAAQPIANPIKFQLVAAAFVVGTPGVAVRSGTLVLR